MPKIYERFSHNSFSSYAETILTNLISAYRKPCSSNHILLRLTENWKKIPRQWKFYGYCSDGSLLGFWLYDFWLFSHDLLVAKFTNIIYEMMQ